MKNLGRWSIVLFLLFCFLPIQTFAAQPRGIYAVYPINEPSDYSSGTIDQLLGNPAVSGITLRERWMHLEPSDGSYQLKRIDEVIDKAARVQKTVQLILVPGFYSPSWMLGKLTRCEDGWVATCGKADFSIPYGPGSRGANALQSLPLPWNPTYTQYWQRFLGEVARRYNTNPTVVSIAIAGPTSVSAEMSLPNDDEAEKATWKKLLQLFYPAGGYQQSNKAIIEEWQKIIAFYDTVFRDKTIILTEGSGLLKFTQGDQKRAKEEIVRTFLQTGFKNNTKGMQTSGMKACRNFESGIGNIKNVTSQSVVGGAQFNSSATNNPSTMGCTDTNVCGREGKALCETTPTHACCSLTPAQAVANVLSVFFSETDQAQIFNVPVGAAHMSYLQVYKDDILFANTNPSVQEQFTKAKTALLGTGSLPSPTTSTTPTQPTDVSGDLNGDGRSNLFDYNLLATDFSKTGRPGFSRADINGDGTVNIKDFTVLIQYLYKALISRFTPTVSTGPRGVYALVEWGAEPQAATWQEPYVDGVVIRTYWRDLNPERGVYVWDFLDRQVQKALQYGKKVRFMVAPGFYSPNWILSDPEIQKASFTVPQGPDNGQVKQLPLPWDARYLSTWFTFVDALAQRYGDNPAFSYISITGPNSHNGEVSLPREAGDVDMWLKLSDNNETVLKNQLLGAWKQAIDRFCTDFPGQRATIALILRSLPIRGAGPLEEAYKRELAAYGASSCPQVFGVQTNGLDGRPLGNAAEDDLPQWDLVASYAGKIFTAFQTRAPGNLYQCKRSGKKCEGTKEEILRQTIQNGLSRHANVLEIYESDILDPTLTTIITKAHNDLTGQ